jgi:hypothetical protein
MSVFRLPQLCRPSTSFLILTVPAALFVGHTLMASVEDEGHAPKMPPVQNAPLTAATGLSTGATSTTAVISNGFAIGGDHFGWPASVANQIIEAEPYALVTADDATLSAALPLHGLAAQFSVKDGDA